MIKVDLQTLIIETKQDVFDSSGTEPDTLDLPFNLYFQLVSSLGLMKDKKFDGILTTFKSMEIRVFWKYSTQFIVRNQGLMFGDGSFNNPISYPYETLHNE